MNEQLEEVGNNNVLKSLKIKGNYIILDFGSFKLKIIPETKEEFKFFVGQSYSKETIENCLFLDKKNVVKKYATNKFRNNYYCSYDIKNKLNKKFNDYPKDAIKFAIRELNEEGIISDALYVKQYVDYFNSACYGKYYVLNYFKLRHISTSIVKKIAFNEELETKKAANYFDSIKNKFVSNNFVKQKKKIYENLLRRGFDINIINVLISTLEFDEEKEEKVLRKNYLKIKNKISGEKINESDKNNKIISKLVSMGFDYDKIKELIKKEGENKND